MDNFMLHFMVSNLFIGISIGILLVVRHFFRHSLTGRTRYCLWFLLLGLLAVPFVPARSAAFFHLTFWLRRLKSALPEIGSPVTEAVTASPLSGNSLAGDFALSVSRDSTSAIGWILAGIWIIGVLVMTALTVKALFRLRVLRRSSLPLQNCRIHSLYDDCLRKLKIHRTIPVYTTAYLTSPVLAGCLCPRIYLPLHLISDFAQGDAEHKGACHTDNMTDNTTDDMRYILLHELQHYKHKDTLINYIACAAGILYWFNPAVHYALKEMRNDREIACDASVLRVLNPENYADYGNALLNFAGKAPHSSFSAFPFGAGISGTMRQMKRRILNISSYQKPTLPQKLKSLAVFGLTALLLFGLAPVLSVSGAADDYYQWDSSSETVSLTDLSSCFEGYEGSFVFYDLERNCWDIYNLERALLRRSPDSTYKIYDALFGLEHQIITPENSRISWNGTEYPFEAWNRDQTLDSAVSTSVNWYFQTIDAELGLPAVSSYLHQIGYGNEQAGQDLSSYWLESDLKISPLEQVELLTDFYRNSFGFAPENMQAVKDSLCLYQTSEGTLYGKTGTGKVNGQDINGWFVGFLETDGHTYFFAANIEAGDHATGSAASEITLNILRQRNLWTK